MESSFEVSLYPLTEDYETSVLTFLDALEDEGLQFSTSGMSTRIVGETGLVMEALGRQFEKIQSHGKATLMIKAGPGRLEYNGRHNREL
ncbi:MAG: YkoF family thiamine/hydroxymethylpyrimidine-binding protein [Verrucomicrobiota bacterium]